MNKIQILEKLKTHIPMIFDIMLSKDMGFEFTAICKKGVIFPNVGMLLSTDTEGDLPSHEWDENQCSKQDCNKNLETFLNSLNLIVPWGAISLKDLKALLEEIEVCKGHKC